MGNVTTSINLIRGFWQKMLLKAHHVEHIVVILLASQLSCAEHVNYRNGYRISLRLELVLTRIQSL